jgi:hypothetical protein
MATTFQKLNLKDQSPILILNSPESFEGEVAALAGVKVLRSIKGVKELTYALAFVTRQAEVDALTATLTAAAKGDAILWFAYPKGTSRRYKCDFNRDTGWELIRAAGWETVRAVAIDEDWSALRFRRKEFIQSR